MTVFLSNYRGELGTMQDLIYVGMWGWENGVENNSKILGQKDQEDRDQIILKL